MMKIVFTALLFCGLLFGAEPLALADPFILLHEGKYYAYGTNHPDGILVYVSEDLREWKAHGLALHKKDTWAGRHFWAPEVYRAGHRFLMYFTAEEHISAAFSDSPLGPFVQPEKKAMLPEEKNIDHTLFIASDGRPYIFWKSWDRNGDGIYVAELEADLTTIRKETRRKCLTPTEPWERKKGRIIEGAFCLESGGRFILTYSANDYRSQDYAIGAAEASSPLGPWKKYDLNPLLHRPGSLVGVGHHSFFRDKSGTLKVVFHAHNSKSQIHPRLTYIADAEIIDGRLRISSEYMPLLLAE